MSRFTAQMLRAGEGSPYQGAEGVGNPRQRVGNPGQKGGLIRKMMLDWNL